MSLETKDGIRQVNRSLTDKERELVYWLLDHGDPPRKELADQVDRLLVREECTCGCPTIYFSLDGEIVPRKGERVISDYLASVETMEVGVMLFANEDKLSSLEVYSCAGSTETIGLPNIETIRPY